MKNSIAIAMLLSLMVLATCLINNFAASKPGQPTTTTVTREGGDNPVADFTPVVINSTHTPTPVAFGKNYYVSTRGNNANPGTQALPFQTITRAAQAARAGDVVLIQAGIYAEKVTPLHSGQPDQYITYQNAGDGEVIIDAQNGQRPACIEINNQSYLKFSGLTVRGANLYDTWPRSGIAVQDGAHHIIMDNITAYDNYVGIMAYGRENPVSFITIKNSKTYRPDKKIGNIHYGIFFYKRVYDSSILHNQVAYSLPEEQSYGIEISTDYPGDQANGPRRIIVSENEVDHNESQGIHTWNAVGVLISGNHLHDNGATGIQIEDGSENIVVENNLSENNAHKYEFEAGVWIDHSKNVVVRGNILKSNKIGLTITYSSRVMVHDNVIYGNNRGAQNLVNAAGLVVDDAATNISITHNTFYKNGVAGMQRGTVNFGAFHASCANITFMNNIVSESANDLALVQDSCSNFVSDFNAFSNTRPLEISWDQQKSDWETYRAVSLQDAHSLTSDPLFVNPQSFNFTLQPQSSLLGKGTILSHSTSSGSGRTVSVTDASYFSDGFGIGNGDVIAIGVDMATITGIDYQANTISLDRTLTWNKNAAVSFPFTGNAPNIGASNLP